MFRSAPGGQLVDLLGLVVGAHVVVSSTEGATAVTVDRFGHAGDAQRRVDGRAGAQRDLDLALHGAEAGEGEA